ncbi:DUF523 domain-containing protein [Serpentinicella sp. ANB-PHB4]|uniref:DUF523 domain-containing protein n=1 Tax=Serpentinicella sp. ANB-PHB4 TaxID=3074076 RepID=UPI002864E263|nr:DUF523 domain-containing protein [Serpentinicella sp. ANB-PHB4]MDR5659889.1 DUF523 domain-containing protein [Serpentinicella sp. ANB-PHB4]
MERIIDERVVLGISACNMGAPIRYNQKGWDRLSNLGREQGDFIWHPVCPEVMAGLGVPRDTIKIVGGNGNDVWEGNARVRSSSARDVTEELKEASLQTLDLLKKVNAVGYVYMEGSPTCGVERTTLKGRSAGKPPGVFGALLIKEGFFLIPALDLESPIKWWDWRRRLHAFVWVKKQEIRNKQDLYNFWYTVKFLCQELAPKAAKQIGKDLANLPKGFDANIAENIKNEVTTILRKPSTLPRIKQRLWKSYVYYKQKFNEEIDLIKRPETDRGMTRIAQELILLEREAFEKGTFFSSAPILYRDKQRIAKMLQKKKH